MVAEGEYAGRRAAAIEEFDTRADLDSFLASQPLDEEAQATIAVTFVAKIILGAATDGTDQLRYIAGPDAEQILANRAALDDDAFLAGMKQTYGLDQL